MRAAQDAALAQGREIGCYTVGVVTCRPTKKEAEEYFHHCIVEHADWSAVDGILALKNISPQTVPMQEYLTKRSQYAQGMGGLPIVGDPDYVAGTLADLSKAGLTGIGISLVNYLNELPYFCDEVIGRLERMGIREKPRAFRHRVAQRSGCGKKLSLARDRRAAFLVVAVDIDPLPHAVDVIGIAAGEGIDRGAVFRIDDKNAADRRLAVVGKERAGGHDVDAVIAGFVEMDAVVAIMLGPRRQKILLVERVDHEQHCAHQFLQAAIDPATPRMKSTKVLAISAS